MKALYPGSVRFNEPGVSFAEALDGAKAQQFYRRLYGGAGNFVFVFTGAITVDEAKRLSALYLASLPAGEKAEARDTFPAFPGGKRRTLIKKGIDQQSLVRIVFGGINPEIEGDIHVEQDLAASLAGLIEIRLRDRIREQMGASYGVGAYCYQENYPARRYSAGINFGCEPARAEELADLALRELEALGETPAGEDDMAKLREIFSRRRETALETNEFWQEVLTANLMRGDEISGHSREEAVLAGIAPETMRRLIRRYFNTENSLTCILLPQ